MVPADGRRVVPAIDGLRCLAAFSVIVAHIASINQSSDRLVTLTLATGFPMLLVFFMISGYLVAIPFFREELDPRSRDRGGGQPDARTFLVRRFLRIFPLYWTVLVTAVILRGAQGLESTTDWVQTIFLLPFPDPNALIVGPLGIATWTLAIEIPFYVLMPVYVAGTRALRRRLDGRVDPFTFHVVGLIGVMTLLAVLGIVFGGTFAFPVMSLPLGMLLAALEVRQTMRRRRYPLVRAMARYWWVCFLGFAALVVVASNLALDVIQPNLDPFAASRDRQFPIQLTQALLVFIPMVFGSKRSLGVRLLASTPFRLLAPLTYGIYLWHPLVLRYTPDWFGSGHFGFPILGTRGFGLSTILISFALAVVSRRLVEKPAHVLRERLEGRGRVRGQHVDGPAGPSSSGGEPGSSAGDDDEVPEGDDHFEEPIDAAEEARRREGRVRATFPLRIPEADRASAGGVDRIPWCEPIDGFRAIFACMAVAAHTFLATAIFPFAGVVHVLAIVVPLFFAISGYVLYQPFVDADAHRRPLPEAWSFYARRLLRVYPVFALALTAYLIALPELRPDNWWGYTRLYLFLQIFGTELNGWKGLPAAWYLCNEVIFYLLMPIMAVGAARWSNRYRLRSVRARLRAHRSIGWAMVIIGPFTRTLLYRYDVPAPSSLPLSHLESFGFGIVLATYAVGARAGVKPPKVFDWLRRNTTLAYSLSVFPLLILALMAESWGDGTGLWTDGNTEDRWRFFVYFAALMLLMPAAVLGRERDLVNRFLSGNRFKALSSLALHIYLWHQLVLGLMNEAYGGLDKADIGSRFVTGLVLLFLALLFTITLSWATRPITDYLYERYRATYGRANEERRGRDRDPRSGSAGRRRPTKPSIRVTS